MADLPALTRSAPVVVFSKLSCTVCSTAKATLREAGIPFEAYELDERTDGPQIFAKLKELTGKQTVPQVFIDGNLIGGGDEIQRLQADELLRTQAEAAGATLTQPLSPRGTLSTDADLSSWVCEQCQGIPGAPQVGKLEVFKQFFRSIMGQIGIGFDKPTVATTSFFELTSRLVTGEIVYFEKFRGKVTLVVNVASQ